MRVIPTTSSPKIGESVVVVVVVVDDSEDSEIDAAACAVLRSPGGDSNGSF